jgi:hypothetical protein
MQTYKNNPPSNSFTPAVLINMTTLQLVLLFFRTFAIIGRFLLLLLLLLLFLGQIRNICLGGSVQPQLMDKKN